MRFFFLDGSALAKRYVVEKGTQSLDYLFDQVSADRLVVLNVGIAEVVSILVRRKNAGVLNKDAFDRSLLYFGKEIIDSALVRIVESTNNLVIAALVHIEKHSINSTDALLLRAAIGLADHFRGRGDDLILMTSDRRLLRAAENEGLVGYDPEVHDLAALAQMLA